MFYVGRTYTATLDGSVLKFETCEKCRTQFVYRAYRRAKGSGHAPYYIGTASAEARAQAGAEKALDRALEKAVDPVRCPGCKHIQAAAVSKERIHRAVRTFGVGLLLTVPLCIFVRVMNLDETGPTLMGIAFLVGLLISAGVSAQWWITWNPEEGRMPIWAISPAVLDGAITIEAYQAIVEEERQAEEARRTAKPLPPANAYPPAAYGAPPPQPQGYPQPQAYPQPQQPPAYPPQMGGMNKAEKAPWER
ncbi:MAG: hypothetical protein H6839_05725 [Planctomycetes bacterium]|nr:hypothetical protein [Planctomycetota bacterium]